MNVIKEGSIASFYTVNKAPIKHLRVYFSPKQAGSGDPSPDNIRLISGWDGIEVTTSGKNLFDKNNEDQIFNAWLNGNRISGSSVDTTVWIKCKPNTTYTISKIGGVMRVGYTAAIPGYNLDLTNSVRHDNIPSITITTDNTAQYLVAWICDLSKTIDKDLGRDVILNSLQIECNDVTTEYEPYKGQTHTIDWSSSVGSVYGGYVDLVTGELVQEWSSIYADGITVKANSSYNQPDYNRFGAGIVYCNPVGLSYVNNERRVFCSTLPTNPMGYGNLPDEDLLYCPYAGQLYVVFYIGRISDHPEITTKQQRIDFTNAWLQEHPTTIVYKLKDPITHQLSPTQLFTLIGRNNIWSNADRVEVEYDLAESNDELYRRRNILLQSAPHIETVSGSLAHFETDLVAPLKECKVYFEPVQEGSGDPSPDNMRAISGWNDIEVYQAGKNLLPSWRSLYANVFANNGTDKGMLVTHLDNGLKITGTATTSGNFNAGGAASRAQLDTQNAPLLKAYTNYIISAEKTSRIGCQGQMVESNREGWVYPNQSFRRSVDGKVWLYSGIAITEGTTYDEQIIIKQLEVGTIATKYEPYRGQTIPIVFPSEAGTIYGGYIDLINGELVQTWKSITLNGEETWNSQAPHTFSNIDYDTMFLSDSLTDMVYQQSTHGIISNMPTSTTASQKSNTGILCGQFGWSDRRFYIFNATQYLDGVSNVATLKAYLSQNPIQICYKLAKPIHYTLTPTQLKTLCGQNNIWSNANGDISIKYWIH